MVLRTRTTKDGRTYTYRTPPYTAAERSMLENELYRDHGKPFTVVKPAPRGGGAATSRRTEAEAPVAPPAGQPSDKA
jgi:hypothetical protein